MNTMKKNPQENYFYCRLTLTEPIGNMLYLYCDKRPQSTFLCLAMAQQVYVALKAYPQAVICMIRQGRMIQALDYARNRADFGMGQFVGVLKNWPTMALAELLIEQKVLPLGVVVKTVWQTDCYDMGLQLVQQLYHKGKQGMKLFLSCKTFGEEESNTHLK